MDWLNYHHLLYFWTVAKEGGVSRAAEVLHLAQPTLEQPDQKAGKIGWPSPVRTQRSFVDID